MQTNWILSLQSKKKWNKMKFGIFTIMFLMQYFCLHSILPFSKSYPKIESTWATTKWSKRKFFDMWYYTVTSATLCVSFSSKSKAINVFPKHISEIKSMWPINSSKKEIVLSRDSKELYLQCFVKVFYQNRKHVDVQNQRTGTPANFTLLW